MIMKEKKKTVFLSYAREDTERVQQLVAALEADGVDVWWDIEIPLGKRFVDVIHQRLYACDYVVVVWSEHAVKSEWVHREASEGLQRNVLLPILFDAVELPFLFKDLHTSSFQNWDGDKSAQDYQNLLAAINADNVTGAAGIGAGVPPSRPASTANQARQPPPKRPENNDAQPEQMAAAVPKRPAKFVLILLVIAGAALLFGAGYLLPQFSQLSQFTGSHKAPEPPLPTPASDLNKPKEAVIRLAANDTVQQSNSGGGSGSTGINIRNGDASKPVAQSPATGPAKPPRTNPQPQPSPAPAIPQIPAAAPTPVSQSPGGNLVFSSSATVPYKVNARPNLILRQRPATGSTKLGNANDGSILFVEGKHGSAVTIDGKTGHWVKTQHPDTRQTVYVFDAYLEVLPAYRVNARPWLHLRSRPQLNAEKLASLKNGMTVYPLSIASGLKTVAGKKGRWVKLRVDEIEGYVFDSFLIKVDG